MINAGTFQEYDYNEEYKECEWRAEENRMEEARQIRMLAIE